MELEVETQWTDMPTDRPGEVGDLRQDGTQPPSADMSDRTGSGIRPGSRFPGCLAELRQHSGTRDSSRSTISGTGYRYRQPPGLDDFRSYQKQTLAENPKRKVAEGRDGGGFGPAISSTSGNSGYQPDSSEIPDELVLSTPFGTFCRSSSGFWPRKNAASQQRASGPGHCGFYVDSAYPLSVDTRSLCGQEYRSPSDADLSRRLAAKRSEIGTPTAVSSANYPSPSQRPSFEHAGLTCYTLLSPSITFSLFHSELKLNFFSENLILYLSLFLSVGLISWL